MKKYDNINYSLFLKIICTVSAMALVFTLSVLLIGLFLSTSNVDRDTYETHRELPKETGTPAIEIRPADSEMSPPHTSGAADTALTPPASESAEDDSQSESAVESSDVTNRQEQPLQPDKPTPTVLGETEDMGEEYLSKIIFVADATNVGLRSYGVLPGGKNTAQVWRNVSGTLALTDICKKMITYPQTGAEMTVPEAAEKTKPEYLVITLGLEGINNLTEESFKAQYKELVLKVREASPNTKIMLQSIYPVASKFTVKDKLNNPLIDKANGWVLEVAESTGVKYLDTCKVLKNGSGALKAEYDNGGTGWSMNATGFGAVLSYIRTHGYR